MGKRRYISIFPWWLLWWLTLLWAPRLIPVEAVVEQQLFRRTPDNQTATEGDKVTLACSIINKKGTLQWTRDGFGLGTDRNLDGYERYRMQGSEEEGDYTLVIEPVTLEDDAIFQCQVGPGPDGSRELRSPNAKLTIEIPTQPPKIMQGDLLLTTEDNEIEIECRSNGGKPAAEITWLDGMGQEIKTGVTTKKIPMDDGKRFNTESVLRFRPRKEHHNKTFTCQAHNRPAKEVMSAFIRLEVKYAPKVSVKILSGPTIREFDNVRVSCRADANPPEMTYRWYLNDKPIIGDHSTLLILSNVTRQLHDAIIKCEVQNAVGKSEESETLEITYGPVFRRRPQSLQVEVATYATLSCDVDGNPNPEIVWIHENSRKVMSTAANMTTLVTEDTAGRYRCQAVVQGFPQISDDAWIYIKGPPKVVSQRVQVGTEGDTVRLECRTQSIPKPERISWFHHAREIDENDEDYQVLEEGTHDGVKSTLIIRSSQEKDFGPYNCSVTNKYGTHVMEIYLMKQKHPELVVILTCVIGGVVVIVAITMITLLCQRKTRKMDMMEPDGMEKETKQSDRLSNNDSDLKVEIRTASSLSNMPEHDSEHWDDEGSEALKNESLYRYSDYIDPVFPPKPDGHNNNGYVPYVDYSRDYNPPLGRNSLYSGGLVATAGAGGVVIGGGMSPQYLNNIDPRYSATYGNPYLRTSNTSLPPPHVGGGGGGVGVNHSPTAGLIHNNTLNNHHHTNHLSSVSSSNSNHSGSNHSSSANHHPHPPPPPHPAPHHHLIPFALRNGAVPQVARSPSTPSPHGTTTVVTTSGAGTVPPPQYIVPSPTQLKPGTLATHV